MKKALYIKLIFFVLFPSLLFSQTITVSDLIYGRTHKVTETQDYLLKKGIEYMGKTPSNFPDATVYGFSAKGLQYLLLVGDANGVIIQVEVYMNSSSNYLSLKQKVKELGYKASNNADEDPLTSHYTKGDSEATFTTGKNEKHGVFYQVTFW